MVKIFIDPGHGGYDAGAVGNGLREKDLTLIIAKKMRDMLSQYSNVIVKLSREDDRYLSLSQRAKMANDWGADIFISIHINSATNQNAAGFETFIYNGTVSQATIANQNVIHAEIVRLTRWRDRGKKRANFAVLRETKMPGLLTENGFISNASDAAKLKQDSFLDKTAEGHVIGLEKVFGLQKNSDGWRKENGHWYYYKNGARKTGWLKDGGKWYYLESSGAMKTGWFNDNGTWYYLKSDGSMAAGWIKDNGKWYFLAENGVMKTGLLQYGGKFYYLKPNGELLVNTTIKIGEDGGFRFE